VFECILPEKAIPIVTYTVSGGTLNPTHSLTQADCLWLGSAPYPTLVSSMDYLYLFLHVLPVMIVTTTTGSSRVLVTVTLCDEMTMILGDRGYVVIKPQRRRLSSYMLRRDNNNNNKDNSSNISKDNSDNDNRNNTNNISCSSGASSGDGGGVVTDGKVPRWLKILLQDDIHTGRNLGAKMSYLCPKNTEQQQQQ